MISVIVPTKGRPDSLGRCLKAVARLEVPGEDLEVIVANDGGGAAVEEVVSSFRGDLRVRLATAVRRGPSAARNAGAAAAGGRFLAFTDDDCVPARGWLSALARSLAADPGAAVGGTIVNGAPESTGATASQAVVEALQAVCNRSTAGPRFFPSSNVAFPAAAFRALGGFDETFRYAEDREICARWVRSGRRFVHAPEAVVVHERRLRIGDFLRQHYGYGRGAWAFHRALGETFEPERRLAVLGELLAAAHRPSAGSRRVAVGAYLVLAELATAAGYLREALGGRLAAPTGA